MKHKVAIRVPVEKRGLFGRKRSCTKSELLPKMAEPIGR